MRVDPAASQTWAAHHDRPACSKEDLARVLEGLRQAASAKQVELICAAYQALRPIAHAHRLDPLKLAQKAMGPSAVEYLVSAFSHLHCFMCQGGCVPCDPCEGEGEIVPGRPCPTCDGLGLAPCPFCRGTNWADHNVIPAEIAQAVHHRQLAHVRDDLHQIVKVFLNLNHASLKALDRAKRRELGGHLLRLSGRLADLLALDVPDPQEKHRLAAMKDKLARCLEALRGK